MTDPATNLRDSLRGITVLDRYCITGFEMQETYGDSYLASRTSDDAPFTVKFAAQGEIRNDDDLVEVLAALDELREFSHPNVEQLFEHGVTRIRDSEALCLVYERTVGETLQAKLSTVPRLSVLDAWRVALRVAEALSVAHRLGVLHGDLRAGNILLLAGDGESNPRVKIRNYGTVRALAPLGRESPALRQLQGSALSMAPEQILGEPVEPATDVYAFGTIFYRMLTGATPFPADNTSKVMQGHLKGLITPLRDAAPDAGIPEVLDAIMARCLARTPRQRYDHGEALLNALVDCQPAVLAAAARMPSRSVLDAPANRSSVAPGRPSSAPRPTTPPPTHPDASQRVAALGKAPVAHPSDAPSGRSPASLRPRAPSQPRLPAMEPVARSSNDSSRSAKAPAALASPSPARAVSVSPPQPSTAAAVAEARAALVRGAVALFAAALAGSLCMTALAWMIAWRPTQTMLLAELQRARSAAPTTTTAAALRPALVRLVLRTNAPNARAWVRGREYPAPVELELPAGNEPERVEVLAQGYVTRREWVIFQRPVTLALDLETEAPVAPAVVPTPNDRDARGRNGRMRARPVLRPLRRNDGRGREPAP